MNEQEQILNALQRIEDRLKRIEQQISSDNLKDEIVKKIVAANKELIAEEAKKQEALLSSLTA